MIMSKIIYEPHPVNTARKAKLQAEGYKIIDAIFAPAGTPIHKKLTEEVAPVKPEVSDELDEAVEKLDDAVEEYIAEVAAKRGRSKKG
jgi:hypothetical protein